jgi:hypothetical protein
MANRSWAFFNYSDRRNKTTVTFGSLFVFLSDRENISYACSRILANR